MMKGLGFLVPFLVIGYVGFLYECFFFVNDLIESNAL